MIGRMEPGNYARIMGEIERSAAIHAALDLDNTAIPIQDHPLTDIERQASHDAAERLGAAYKTIPERLGKLCFLDINTGRTDADYVAYEEANEGLTRFAPYLDGRITSVGTAIHFRIAPNQFVHDMTWPSATGWSHADIAGVLAEAAPFEGTVLEPQPSEAQDDYKLSYDLFGLSNNSAALQEFSSHVSALLDKSNLQAGITLSFDPHKDKHYVDLLPPGADKGSSFIYAGRQHLSRAFAAQGSPVPSEAHAFKVAGADSYNDISALAAADLALLPGNAHDSVVNWAEATIPHKLYRAEASFAEGIHEGLAYFGIVSPGKFAAGHS